MKGAYISPKYYKVNEKKKWIVAKRVNWTNGFSYQCCPYFSFQFISGNIHGCLNKVSCMFHCVQNQSPQFVDLKTVRKL